MKKRNIPTICLPIETKVREFDSKILLASHFLNKGYNVLIGSRSAVYREMELIKYPVLLAKNASKVLIEIYEYVKKQDGLNIILDEEGTVFYEDEDSVIKFKIPQETIPYLDLYLSSGKAISDLIIKNIPVLKQRVITCGNPRFDLLKRDYDNYFKDSVENLQRLYGNYILINTSFGSGNTFDGIELQRKRVLNYPDYNEKIRDILLKKIDWNLQLLEDYVSAVKEISKTFKELKIVLRPHPSEKIDTYINAFQGLNNVYISKEGNVVEWIRGARLIIHYDCTTGIEAKLCGKKVISYTPHFDKELAAWLPLYISDSNVNTTESLIEIIKKCITENEIFQIDLPKNKKDKLGDYIDNLNYKSSPVIVDNIIELIKNRTHKFRKMHINIYLFLFKRLKAIYSKIWANFTHKSGYYDRYPGTTKKEIKEKVNKFLISENLDFDYVVRRKGQETFLIKNKQKNVWNLWS